MDQTRDNTEKLDGVQKAYPERQNKSILLNIQVSN